MFNFFKRKTIEKESNVANTPSPVEPVKDRWTKMKVLFFVWNLVSITLYSAYTLFVIYNFSINTFLSKVIKWLLLIYAIAFVLLILINIGNRKRMNMQLKNYKSATNFLKYAMQILNFVLSIATAISALFATGKFDFSGVLWATLLFFLTLVSIMFEVAKIIIRKNITVIKQNFLDIREKPRKSIWLSKKDDEKEEV